ncbi:VCBS repeat-containing protein [Streptomyces albus]|uniref:VCBS repeat-containing protein n=1 Tax=Streptomyces albus TaxID=1888 RepID=A0A8H1LKB4_9ACTN|nr:VCBS repeat-containing protein [Streptomyces albus]
MLAGVAATLLVAAPVNAVQGTAARPADSQTADSAVDGPITRSEMRQRAKSWIDERVPYDQASFHTNQYGRYRQDCSGYVSMAWHLGSSYTTRSLPDVMNTIARSELRFGDALWRVDSKVGHVALFVRWADAAHTRPVVWEEYDYGHVAEERTWTAAYAGTFTPKRYRNVVEDGTGSGSASLSGDGRADIVKVGSDGVVKGWRNGAGFAAMPWDAWADKVATEFTGGNIYFPDLDGDGKRDIARVLENGDVKAWHNGAGFGDMPWDGWAKVGTEFRAGNVFFPDLDGDGRDDIARVLDNGDIQAWHNGGGFAEMPWDNWAVIATDFTPENVRFADLDGDGRDDILKVGDDGKVQAWHNGAGFAEKPWDNYVGTFATEFSKDNIFFADLDGDGKDDIARVLDNGDVKAWHNGAGFAEMPWDDWAIVGTEFTKNNLSFA